MKSKSISVSIIVLVFVVVILVFIPEAGYGTIYSNEATIYGSKKESYISSTQIPDIDIASEPNSPVDAIVPVTVVGQLLSINDVSYADNISNSGKAVNTIVFNLSKRYLDAARVSQPALPNYPFLPIAIAHNEFGSGGGDKANTFFIGALNAEYIENQHLDSSVILSADRHSALASKIWDADSIRNVGNTVHIGPMQFSETYGADHPAIAGETGLVYSNSKPRVDMGTTIPEGTTWRDSGTKYGDRWNLADILNNYWGYTGDIIRRMLEIPFYKEQYMKMNDYSKIAYLAMAHNTGEGVMTYIEIDETSRLMGISRRMAAKYCQALGNDAFITELRKQIAEAKPTHKDQSQKIGMNLAIQRIPPLLVDDPILQKHVSDTLQSIGGKTNIEKMRFPVSIIANYIMLEQRYNGEY